MKNVHLISTYKPSRLVLDTVNNNLFLTTTKDFGTNIMKFHNIYITDNSEIKVGDYGIIDGKLGKVVLTDDGYEFKLNNISYWFGDFHSLKDFCKKIILTTDQDLISDGIQAIDDEFLEWFCKNSSCEFVKTNYFPKNLFKDSEGWEYVITIPKEEFAKKMLSDNKHKKATFETMIEFAKWQQEQIGKSKFLQKLNTILKLYK